MLFSKFKLFCNTEPTCLHSAKLLEQINCCVQAFRFAILLKSFDYMTCKNIQVYNSWYTTNSPNLNPITVDCKPGLIPIWIALFDVKASLMLDTSAFLCLLTLFQPSEVTQNKDVFTCVWQSLTQLKMETICMPYNR